MQLLQLVSGETKKLWAGPRQIKVQHFQKQASKGLWWPSISGLHSWM